MAGEIIYLVISFLVSMIFVILGIVQYKSKTPVSINTGEKPPREDELTDMKEWNHKHGRNFIIYGCALFLTLTVFLFFIRRFDNVVVQLVVFFAIIAMEIVWLEAEHIHMKKTMIKK